MKVTICILVRKSESTFPDDGKRVILIRDGEISKNTSSQMNEEPDRLIPWPFLPKSIADVSYLLRCTALFTQRYAIRLIRTAWGRLRPD